MELYLRCRRETTIEADELAKKTAGKGARQSSKPEHFEGHANLIALDLLKTLSLNDRLLQA